MARLQSEAIDVARLADSVGSDADGAVALFVGTVRDHNEGRRVRYLEYHAYREMAEREMAAIEQDALRRYGVTRVEVVHRVGRVEIGEASVAVAVAAPHRAEAFDACRHVIDTLKRSVPIWKKEHFEGGAAWIDGAG